MDEFVFQVKKGQHVQIKKTKCVCVDLINLHEQMVGVLRKRYGEMSGVERNLTHIHGRSMQKFASIKISKWCGNRMANGKRTSGQNGGRNDRKNGSH